MKFSISLIVLNEENYVGAVIGSILNQGFDFELFVVDGGSTDGTERIVKSYQNPNIYWYKGDGSKHLHERSEEARRMSTGDIFYGGAATQIFPYGAFKIIAENCETALFGSTLHTNGIIQKPLNPEVMSSDSMFFNLHYMNENMLYYDYINYPDIADYVIRKKVWLSGKFKIIDEILMIRYDRPTHYTDINRPLRRIQMRKFKEELKIFAK